MKEASRPSISVSAAINLVSGYARRRVQEQVKAVSFIIFYLVVFQTLILGSPLLAAGTTAIGIGFVVFGLAFFLEGIFLALMPLGERVGVKLTAKAGLLAILFFGGCIGLASTLAEPSIAILRNVGSNLTPWETPLLFLLLNKYTTALVMAVAVGVAFAVLISFLRLFYGFSIKPILLVCLPLALLASVAALWDKNLASIIGLAWDTGAITTGPVTVPIVLSLGLGISRATGKTDKASGGFGLVALASILPVFAVLALGVYINTDTAQPVSEATFYSEEFRSQALAMYDSEIEFFQHGVQVSSETIQRTLLAEWSEQTKNKHSNYDLTIHAQEEPGLEPVFLSKLWEEGRFALRAILPLLCILGLALVLTKEKPLYMDEALLGIALAILGMTLLTSGVHFGLAPLGDNVGKQLPRTFSGESEDLGVLQISDFDEDLVFSTINPHGERQKFFYLQSNDETKTVLFIPDQYDPEKRTYTHFVSRPPFFGPNLTFLGLLLVFLFAFGLGWGATLAEPSLNALAGTVEDLTVGLVKRKGVIYSVSFGVGIGLLAGVARIIFDIPILYLLLPPYLLLLPLTLWSEKEFTGIAWDCGGVTTGPVTVPLVLSMGMGIGHALSIRDGFGILALASVYPIISVMIYGIALKFIQSRAFKLRTADDNNE